MNKSIVLGAGCFWGVEELLRRLEGVRSAVSGYCGGGIDNPSYEQICTGKTGHAEVVRVEYDSSVLSLENLLIYFFKLHDPTTINAQGFDIGTQYRSAIFFENNEDQAVAKNVIEQLNNKHFNQKIVTEVSKLSTFFKAEEYHQQYYLKKYNGSDGPICHFIREW